MISVITRLFPKLERKGGRDRGAWEAVGKEGRGRGGRCVGGEGQTEFIDNVCGHSWQLFFTRAAAGGS